MSYKEEAMEGEIPAPRKKKASGSIAKNRMGGKKSGGGYHSTYVRENRKHGLPKDPYGHGTTGYGPGPEGTNESCY